MLRPPLQRDWTGLALPTQLGSGTNDGTTFLRGDRRWAVPIGAAPYVNVTDSPYLAVGDGVTDDYPAIQAAINATPRGKILYFPVADSEKGYRCTSGTPTLTQAIHIVGEGFRVAAGVARGSLITQDGGVAQDAFYIDASAGELDGIIIENMMFGTTVNGRHALHLSANVNRSVFRNIFLCGAVESAFKQATPGNHILNYYENIRISQGFMAGLPFAVPKRGFDLGAGSTSLYMNCGAAGVTTAPGIGWDFSNGPLSNRFIFCEAESNTVGLQFGGAASGNEFYGFYQETNGTLVGGSTTTPRNLSILAGGGTGGLEFPAAIGLTLGVSSVTLPSVQNFFDLPRVAVGPLLAPWANTLQGTLHVSRTGVTNTFNADVEGGTALFAHVDSNVADVLLGQLVATGALADARLHIGANGSQNVGDIGMRAYQRSTGTQRNININKLSIDVIATASLPAAAASENGRIIIEDNGAGDRNLFIYAGGQRFRIDGGAAVP